MSAGAMLDFCLAIPYGLALALGLMSAASVAQAQTLTIGLRGESRGLEAAANYNFSRASTIYGGSNEVQYNVMAKRVLGL